MSKESFSSEHVKKSFSDESNKEDTIPATDGYNTTVTVDLCFCGET